MRVAGAVAGVLLVGLAAVLVALLRRDEVQPCCRGDVERGLLRLLVYRGVDRGLEVGLEDDDVGLGDRGDLSGAQLEVVGLGPRLGQPLHGDVLTADLLHCVLQRVEGSHDVEPSVVGVPPPGRAAGGDHGDGQQAREQTEGAERHDNHSHLK